AGNEGNKSRNHIMTPGDAADALTVGSVNIEGEPSEFSSRGSLLMGRVKPDVSALGENVSVLDESGAVTSAAGTSFSTPLIAGLAACLWEKFPQFSPSKIMDAIRGSASNSLAPDTLKGYGIPNFKKAADILAAFNDSL
ncbi:MAG: S8 family serine peptidase, partial [Bacteroidales bacterium]|nr:S8 family serine peptidase [Bacteroidales bacterium]